MINNLHRSLCLLTGVLLTVSCTSMAQVPGASIDEQRSIKPVTSAKNGSNDRLGRLIEDTEQAYQSDRLSIEQNTRIRPYGGANQSTNSRQFGETNYNYTRWLSLSPYRANEVARYRRYLASYLGDQWVPPFDQLLTTARSWERCGYEQYQLPPSELWSNMIPTLRLYKELKSQGVIPPTAEIRSTYRSPSLNACAGGASASKHMTNGAIDIWVPEYDDQPWYRSTMQEKLCKFWVNQGERHSFGLGLYATGAIHLDTQGYRMWGKQNTDLGSYCRYIE